MKEFKEELEVLKAKPADALTYEDKLRINDLELIVGHGPSKSVADMKAAARSFSDNWAKLKVEK